jgi:multidrug transporter EmrE-like cation transporter
MGKTYALVLLGMLLNVAAQVALKHVSRRMPADYSNLLSNPLVLISDPFFLFGLALYAFSVINWVVVLGRLDLSVAYPLMSLGYILTLFAGVWFFHEPVNATRLTGVLTIIVGVVLISRPVAHV